MDNIEQVLEFNLVKEKLLSCASLHLTKERISKLSFNVNEEQIKKDLNISDEANKLVLKYGNLRLEEIGDIEKYLTLLSKGLKLNIDEIYNVYTLLLQITKIQNYFTLIKNDEFINFTTYVKALVTLPILEKQITKIISPLKTINDNASPVLKKIRNDIINLEEQIKNKLNQLIGSNNKLLSDTTIMYRNGKLVLAINSSHKYVLGGIVVDESTSGYTSYVQPEAVYKIDLKINNLKQQETDEIKRILAELSNLIFHHNDELLNNFKIILDIDFMFAKGVYANKIKGTMASISDNEVILNNARHPLINENEVIANSFTLGDNKIKTLIITGPNSGGKTVALKTVGLLAYMNQCGLLISADENSSLPIFSNFYADIGDGQSLISSLSTFSAHISKIIKILSEASKNSLILLDELGSGTDPKEGESLAMALIDDFALKDTYLLTTTHYENLKNFALENKQIRVCSMEFDEINLTPTYKILKDQIGKSYALQISKKYGLNDDIIEKAKQYKKQYSSTQQKSIHLLEGKLNDANNIINEYNEQQLILKEKIELAALKEMNLEKEINKVKFSAKEEKEKLIDETKEKIKIILDNLKNNKDLKIHEAIEALKKVDDLVEKKENLKSKTKFKIDDEVMIVSINQTGKVIAFKDDLYDISNGKMVFKVRGYDLKHSVKEKKVNKIKVYTNMTATSLPLELNLIGKRVEESLFQLDEYLNNAVVANLVSVRVIHGFGTGNLRKGIHEYLKKSKLVESFHYGGVAQGGQGATIVVLKK